MTTSPLLKWTFSIATSIVAIIEPAIPFVTICFAAIIWDCWTAYKLSKRVKLHTGLSTAKFKSKKADKIIETGINALVFVVLSIQVNKYVTKDFGDLHLPNIASAIVIGVQLVSVCENISSCNTKWWARLLQKIFTDKSSRHYDINEEYMSTKPFWSKFASPTPQKWKKIRNTAATFLAVVVAISGTSSVLPGINTPQWFTDYAWYIGAVLGAVVAYAQSKEEKNSDK
jgi:hypothetical protein